MTVHRGIVLVAFHIATFHAVAFHMGIFYVVNFQMATFYIVLSIWLLSM